MKIKVPSPAWLKRMALHDRANTLNYLHQAGHARQGVRRRCFWKLWRRLRWASNEACGPLFVKKSN